MDIVVKDLITTEDDRTQLNIENIITTLNEIVSVLESIDARLKELE